MSINPDAVLSKTFTSRICFSLGWSAGYSSAMNNHSTYGKELWPEAPASEPQAWDESSCKDLYVSEEIIELEALQSLSEVLAEKIVQLTERNAALENRP